MVETFGLGTTLIARSFSLICSFMHTSSSMRRSAFSGLDGVAMNRKKFIVCLNSPMSVGLSSIWPRMGWR